MSISKNKQNKRDLNKAINDINKIYSNNVKGKALSATILKLLESKVTEYFDIHKLSEELLFKLHKHYKHEITVINNNMLAMIVSVISALLTSIIIQIVNTEIPNSNSIIVNLLYVLLIILVITILIVFSINVIKRYNDNKDLYFDRLVVKIIEKKTELE